MSSDPAFLGRGWHFPPRFDPHDGRALLVEAEDDIEESLRILMSTRPGERVMHPTYGCRLHDYLFEPMNGTTRAAIEAAIARAVLFFEPRVRLASVSVSASNWPGGKLTVQLDYAIVETNSRHNVVFPFYIEEGTLVRADQLPAA